MDNRQFRRVFLGSRYQARFKIDGLSYSNIIITNLGSGGCCIQVPTEYAAGVRNKSLLDGWELIHPTMPKGMIKAKVVWIHGLDKTRSEYFEAGVQFIDAPLWYSKDLYKYVTTMAKSGTPGAGGRSH